MVIAKTLMCRSVNSGTRKLGTMLSSDATVYFAMHQFKDRLSEMSPCVFASKYVTPHHTDDLLPIKFKCQYSSLASLLGSPAQANYCSANARIDHAAARDRLAGRLSPSIQWGP